MKDDNGVHVTHSVNVYRDPDWPMFSAASMPEPAPAGLGIGAISFSAYRSIRVPSLDAAASQCFSVAARSINHLSEDFRWFLFVADDCWQPSSAVIRRRRLWRRFRDSFSSFRIMSASPEVFVESPFGIRFCGVLELDLTETDMMELASALRMRVTWFLFLTRRPVVHDESCVRWAFDEALMTTQGLVGGIVQWPNIVRSFCVKQEVLIRVSGGFDDQEACTDVFVRWEPDGRRLFEIASRQVSN